MRRTLLMVLILALAGASHAQDVSPSAKKEKDKHQIDWVGDWDGAFKQAKEKERIVMVCINSKDGEVANERAAGQTYKDEEFVTLTRSFVMIVVSTRDHTGMFGTCKRFGGVTCQQHIDCYKLLRAGFGEQFLMQGNKGEMISPQHAWFTAAGKLIYRKEYELTKEQLMTRMRTILKESKTGPADEPDDPDVDPADKPLSEKDKFELDRVKTGGEEGRRAGIGNLLRTGKRAAKSALVDLLLTTKKVEIKCDILRGLGRGNCVETRETIEGFLDDKSDLVRSFAAVALEELQQTASIEALLKRAKRERERYARKNMVRALGKCAGPSAHEKAAKALLKAISSDKQAMVRKHAALALRSFDTDEGKKLVLKKLEQMAEKSKDPNVRGGIVYTLSHIGSTETTLPIFEEILEKLNNKWAEPFMRTAIKVLQKRGTWDGRSTWWLWSEDRDDPAREVAPGPGPGAPGGPGGGGGR